MSVKISGKVWEMNLSHNEKYVLLALADHSDHDGNNAYPGLELLEAKIWLLPSQHTVHEPSPHIESYGFAFACVRAGSMKKFAGNTLDISPRRS